VEFTAKKLQITAKNAKKLPEVFVIKELNLDKLIRLIERTEDRFAALETVPLAEMIDNWLYWGPFWGRTMLAATWIREKMNDLDGDELAKVMDILNLDKDFWERYCRLIHKILATPVEMESVQDGVLEHEIAVAVFIVMIPGFASQMAQALGSGLGFSEMPAPANN
jgi:hypothetical protein